MLKSCGFFGFGLSGVGNAAGSGYCLDRHVMELDGPVPGKSLTSASI